jgi:hypothetical protein
MIENYRTGFLWNLFMANEEIRPALASIGFVPDSVYSMQDHSSAEKISCFPNPVQNTLNIKNLKNASLIIITNMLGQQVKAFKNANSNQVQLPVDDLAAGLYNVSLYNGQQMTTMKFIKE